MAFSNIRFIFLAVVLLMPAGAMAQTSSDATSNAPQLTSGQLDQLVAPIALYPDPLLAEVLMASTYPLQVVEAHRWLDANKNLQGDALKAAVDKQSWDDSVKSLIATPSVLDMMSSQLDWMQKLGNAVLAQQAQVMDAVQRLRSRAQANNKLASTSQQNVTVTQQASGPATIAIEPTDPEMLYVPYYDPGVVYGDWPYSDYPPYYFPAPGYIAAGVIATGIAFGAGYALGRWANNGYRWGGGMNWGGNNIAINRPINGNGARWQPRVDHRQNFGNRGGREQGLNFRGSNGQRVINPGNRGAGAGAVGNRGANISGGNRVNNRAANISGGNRGGNRGGANVSHRARNTGAGRNQAMARRGGGGAAQLHRGGGGARMGGMRGGGGMHAMRGGGGGGFRGGGGRGGGGGGRRRSDIALKHDIVLLGRLDNGLGFYRFSYVGSEKPYVGVIAQEVQQVMPQAVMRDRSGYLLVDYGKLGVPFESYQRWVKTGARVPQMRH